jgi:hypothetical protein
MPEMRRRRDIEALRQLHEDHLSALSGDWEGDARHLPPVRGDGPDMSARLLPRPKPLTVRTLAEILIDWKAFDYPGKWVVRSGMWTLMPEPEDDIVELFMRQFP